MPNAIFIHHFGQCCEQGKYWSHGAKGKVPIGENIFMVNREIFPG